MLWRSYSCRRSLCPASQRAYFDLLRRSADVAAAAKVKTHPISGSPRCRSFRSSAISFSHPKHSSIRFLFLWLTAYTGWQERSCIGHAAAPIGSHRRVQSLQLRNLVKLVYVSDFRFASLFLHSPLGSPAFSLCCRDSSASFGTHRALLRLGFGCCRLLFASLG